MPCTVVGNAIICSRGGRRTVLCAYCGRPQEVLCDFPLTGARARQTCDKPMCRACATHVEPDEDYCRAHAKMRMAL